MYLKNKERTLYYEVRGKGAPLLLIHGVLTDAGTFETAADLLSSCFRVITYDRRGNSRSKGGDEQAFSMEDQIRDIRDLLDQEEADEAYVVGVSAGAVIGERFAERYPKRVRHLILYEPAVMWLMMRHDEDFRRWALEMRDLVDRKKFNMALFRLAQQIGTHDRRSPEKTESLSQRELSNTKYALAVEIPSLFDYQPDVDWMRCHADRITIAAGEKSGDTAYVRAAEGLARELGKRTLYFPGSHNLPYDLPQEFAICVLGTLTLANRSK